MKQCKGQMNLTDFIPREHPVFGCGECVCKRCLYWWSERCPHGDCYDDQRAKTDPYDKAHPEKPPRTGWSDWNKPGEQEHWCRGGGFYPVRYCEHYTKYEGSSVEDCVDAPMQIFQDGYVRCSLKETMGCEACIERSENRKARNQFDCPYMTDTGCEKMIAAKSLMLDAISEGEEIEMCREQCCIGCTKTCGYRCGQAV